MVARLAIVAPAHIRAAGFARHLDKGLHAVRGGDIVGDHTILFAGPGERLEFKHQAHSRDVFAHGAAGAAAWLAGKSAGWYALADVLGLKAE